MNDLCIERAVETAEKILDKDEITFMLGEFEKISESRKAWGQLNSTESQMLNYADEMTNMIKEDKLIKKRNHALKVIKRQNIIDFVSRFKTPGKGLSAKIVGRNINIKGGLDSTAVKFGAIQDKYYGGLINNLRKEGLEELWLSNSLEGPVAKELWEINSPRGKPGISGSKEAQRIAEIVTGWQRTALERMNRAGANIRSLRGYVTRQSHNMDKVRQAGWGKWIEFVMPRVDEARTFRGKKAKESPEEFMRNMYEEIVTGRIFKAVSEEDMYQIEGVNIAKKASQSRFLHFKTSDDFLAYQKQFGSGNLLTSIHGALDQAARNTALMEDWGPNPEMMLDKVLSDLQTKNIANEKNYNSLAGSKEKRIKREFMEVTGEVNIPVSSRAANFGKVIRSINNVSKLGRVLLTSLVDPAIVSSEFRYQGARLLGSYQKSLQAFIEGQKGGLRKDIAEMIGVGLDGLRGDVVARFSFGNDELPGMMSRMQQRFFRMSGLIWWNDSWKRGVGLMMSRDLAKQRRLSWDQLGDRLKTVLNQYEIEGRDWDLIRKAGMVLDEDGNKYITPAIVDNMDDMVIAKHLGLDVIDPVDLKNIGSQGRRVRRFKDELSTKLRSYIVDRVDYAILTPGAREMAMVRRGHKPGTLAGEALRYIWQFKTFPLAMVTKIYGRELSKGAKSGTMGLVHLALATTIMGYVAQSAKAIAKGRTPRPPDDKKTWVGAFIQGGGAGIYADFLFGMQTRYGHGPLSSALGPTASTAEDVIDIFQRAIQGRPVAAKTMRTALQNTPFMNLHFTRAAFDYLLFYQMQEAMNPGYLRRMEAGIKRHNKQTYFIRPSKVIPHGGGDKAFAALR